MERGLGIHMMKEEAVRKEMNGMRKPAVRKEVVMIHMMKEEAAKNSNAYKHLF